MICVIDYGVGNLFSVEKALLQFSSDVNVTSSKEEIEKADDIMEFLLAGLKTLNKNH